MSAENGSGVHGQGAVHEDLDLGQFAGGFQLIEHVHDLLRPPHAEGGDEEFAAFLHAGVFHDFQETLHFVRLQLVFAVAVGGFAEEVIAGRHRLGVAEDGAVRPADVSGEPEGGRRTVLAFNAQRHAGAAQDVARVAVLEVNVFGDPFPAVVGQADEALHGRFYVRPHVERLLGFTVLPVFFVVVFRILFLDESRVQQQNGAEAARSVGGVDLTAKAVFYQLRHPAGVVDVGVAEDEAVNALRLEDEVFVEVFHLFIAPLIEAAVEQNGVAVVKGDQVSGPGYFAGRAAELNLHG